MRPMNETFAGIQNEAIRRAQQVKCSHTDYISGLETMMCELDEELTAAKESAGISDSQPAPVQFEMPDQ